MPTATHLHRPGRRVVGSAAVAAPKTIISCRECLNNLPASPAAGQPEPVPPSTVWPAGRGVSRAKTGLAVRRRWHEVGQAVEKLAGREVDDAVLTGAGGLAPAARSDPRAAVVAGQRERGRSQSRGCRSGDAPTTPPRRASGPASRRGCERRAGFPARSCQRGSSTASSRRVRRPAWPWRASPLGWASTWNDGREWRRRPGRDRRPDAVGGLRASAQSFQRTVPATTVFPETLWRSRRGSPDPACGRRRRAGAAACSRGCRSR